MKYIFKYSLVTQYTTNPDNLQLKDLISTLKTNKFTQEDQIQYLLDLSKQCASQLIKNLGKSAQLTNETIKQVINQNFKDANDNFNVDELIQTWESQKSQIISKILAQSSKTQSKISQIHWEVSTRISSRYPAPQEKSAILSILSCKHNKSTCKTIVELNRDDLNKIGDVLLSAADFLDENLK